MISNETGQTLVKLKAIRKDLDEALWAALATYADSGSAEGLTAAMGFKARIDTLDYAIAHPPQAGPEEWTKAYGPR